MVGAKVHVNCRGSRFAALALPQGRATKAPPRMVARRELGHLMGIPVRLCALVGRFSDPRVAESVNALIPHLLSRQVKVIVSEETTYSGDAAGIGRIPEKDI